MPSSLCTQSRDSVKYVDSSVIQRNKFRLVASLWLQGQILGTRSTIIIIIILYGSCPCPPSEKEQKSQKDVLERNIYDNKRQR